MLKTQKSYINYLSQIEEVLKTIKLSENTTKSFALPPLKEAVKNQKLLIPVIGAFSAGKSSLINSFLGKDYLPVGVTPETALATEIRFSESGTDERIEAVKEDSSIELFKLEDMEIIKSKASGYKFLRLFVNNNRVREIEPLILVDMPGFESPFDLHNKAIMEYLDKGVYYIVLTSVGDGTLTRSMIRQLEDIQNYKRDFSFFLSKSNLRSADEVESVKEALKEKISECLDLSKEVVAVDDNGGESLEKILLQVDPEKLFSLLFIDDLKNNFYSINDSINNCLFALNQDKKKNGKIIEELKKSLQSTLSKKEQMLKESKENYSAANINSIVDGVGNELSNAVDELADIALKRGSDAFSAAISEIVRNSLISNLNESISSVANDVVDMFSSNLSDLSETLSEFSLPEGFVEKISDQTKSVLQNIGNGLRSVMEKRKESAALYKTLTSILAITTNVIAPILELVLVFLPDIAGVLFKKAREQKQKDNIKNQLFTGVIPEIKRKLRNTLPELFNKQIEDMIQNISSQFETEIIKKQEDISFTENEIKSKITSIDKEVAQYENAVKELNLLAKDLLFS